MNAAERLASTEPTPGFALEEVSVRFGDRLALDGVTLAAAAGVHGLLGPNGAGKTTLIRLLATVTTPTSGAITLLGLDARRREARPEIRRRLGYLPQSFGFYPRYTVREFVAYFAWLKQLPAREIPLAVDRALERVGLLERADDRMKSLSGGMVRRAGIAQAIVNDPALLLLDEPTAGLDPEQRVSFRELVREVGVDAFVVISTHLVEDVAAACTRVQLLDAGRVVFTGSPQGLIDLGEDPAGSGDTAIERGYTAALRRARRAAGGP
ncbi:MAG: ABC transporter ATP-binding protein [Tetrasphaera sp.]